MEKEKTHRSNLSKDTELLPSIEMNSYKTFRGVNSHLISDTCVMQPLRINTICFKNNLGIGLRELEREKE